MSAANDLVGGQACRCVGWRRRREDSIIGLILTLSELLKAGETIQVFNVDAFRGCGKHLLAAVADSEIGPFRQFHQPGFAEEALRPMNTVGKGSLLA